MKQYLTAVLPGLNRRTLSQVANLTAGVFVADNIVVQPDASGNTNVVGATEITLGLYYVDELATDLWASI